MELIENKTAKNKGGRPELKTKKDTSINVRMTRLERILIEQKAKQAKLSATAWFRKAAKRAKIHPRITEEDMKILRVLAGMANNLNQLTKLAHTYGFLKFQKDCQELISKINMVFKEFKGKQE
jgi:hypothetical protein